MTAILIDSADDPRVAAYRDLPEGRTPSEFMVAEGRWLVDRLLASEFEVESVLCAETLAADYQQRVPELPTLVASRAVIEQVVGFRFHRGVLACARRRPLDTVGSLCGRARPRDVFVICCGIGDKENLGAIVRTAEALGAGAVVLDSRCADPYSRPALRVSMGAVLTTPIAATIDMNAALTSLKEANFQVCASVLCDEALSLDGVPRPARLALVLGNEGFGIDPEVLEECDVLTTLPMQGSVDSLNVAVAAGVLLYHFRDQPRTE